MRLEQLGFEGSGQKAGEVTLGRSPPADPSLVAAVRTLAATDEGQLLGHSVQDLGLWHKPVHNDTEVGDNAVAVAQATHASWCMICVGQSCAHVF